MWLGPRGWEGLPGAFGIGQPGWVYPAGEPAGVFTLFPALVSLAVVLVRVLRVFPATYLPHLLSRSVRERDPYPPWRNIVVIVRAGMRGVISLALPLTAAGGGLFPDATRSCF